ncbi:hypothetical protein [Streptomyces vietnamensis]|uniref:Uncharacterized protein n=1 Tax=Streptomyces vietnamensis TaxID=362257 RepID=A0A0B5I1I6_9ACTN|nr:hypothetical protein [Streptomyces vietnamensis]AJF63508.1 hypothetical protein SVTN_02455 [Streptomyces vietnamensis]
MNHADGTAPIYAELIRERGDVPGDVRQVAEEVLRDLSRVIQMPPQGIPGPQQGAVAHAGAPHPGAGGPMGVTGPMGAVGPMGVGGPAGMVGQAGAVVPHRPML